VFLWFVGAALVVAWVVFRDPAIDHRVLVAGALLPDAVDLPFGGARVAHTLLASVALLAAVMAVTRGRRAARRRWLALPIGTFVHLVADGAWTRAETFWWPFLGGELAGPLPSLDHGLAVVLAMELAGAVAVAWFVTRTGLAAPAARATFWRTGHPPQEAAG
jgi:hypothetical protein